MPLPLSILCVHNLIIISFHLLVILKTIQRPPYGSFILIKFTNRFFGCLAFGDAACLQLRLYPEVDLAVKKNLIGNKASLIHFGKYAIVKKCVGEFDVHFNINKVRYGLVISCLRIFINIFYLAGYKLYCDN